MSDQSRVAPVLFHILTLGVISGMLLLGASRPAKASPPETTCRSQSACQTVLERATRLHQAGQNRAALLAFQQAYRMSREHRILVNIGRELHHLGRPLEALASYQSYQNLAQRLQLDDDLVQERLPQFIAEARALLPLRPSPAVVTAQSAAVENPTVRLDLKPEVKLPEVRVQVDLKLPPIAGPDSLSSDRKGAPWYRRGWVWASLGGVAATAIGVGVGYVAYRQQFPILEPIVSY